ncbi:hypothetical protein jhhlp_005536 [Lomentospora prolificans]|uniref:DUF3984 domain-containing protein n=1 Tax=Lomentospora prolificans TaxID=41688 RepID=A0A2N3N3C6_9PEZI|nr:hypothetical protein jhhlp_005536 [Lomentospora prolificans]
MDEAFNQHATRRKNRSSTNLNRLTLAPLTSRLPLDDLDSNADVTSRHRSERSVSYIEGKSAPTTPRLLSRSAARSPTRTRFAPIPGATLTKSKSATHLSLSTAKIQERTAVSGTASPLRRRKEEYQITELADRDWLFRTGALMSSEAREFKGQAWLVSRASSTSLTVARDDEDEDIFEQQLEREREFASRHSSRRGSLANLNHARSTDGNHNSRSISRPHSQSRSRPHSRPESRANMFTPMDRADLDDYFAQSPEGDEYVAGPDFVNLDERLEALGKEAQDDEATIRKLVRRGQAGRDSWLANVLGWSLFSVEEDDDESDSGADITDTDTEGLPAVSRSSSTRYLDHLTKVPEEPIPPPQADQGGWNDAAWLLSVASRVIL